MSQRIYGAGLAWVTPTVDASGVAIANPTPIILGTMQEVSIDISFETSELYGSDSQSAKAIARGKMKVTGKAKFADINGSIFNQVVFGQSQSNGLSSVSYDTAGSVVPVGLTITPTVPNTGTLLNDLGVVFATTGLPLKRVNSTPAVGEYTVNLGTGAYGFNTADQTKVVYITFSYTAVSTTAKTSTISKKVMGLTPTFALDIYLPYEAEAQSTLLHLYKCTSSKFSFGTKLNDFVNYDLDFQAFNNSAGKLMDISTTE